MDQYYYVCRNDLFYAVQIFRPCNGVLAGGRTKTTLTLEDVKHVTEFLLNFADQRSCAWVCTGQPAYPAQSLYPQGDMATV